MAISLALTAGGILICYLLCRRARRMRPGKTMNAVLAERFAGRWRSGAAARHGVRRPDPGRRGAAAVRRRPGRLHRRPAGDGEHGARLVAAAPVRRAVRPADHAERRAADGGGRGSRCWSTPAATYGTLVVMYSINVFLTFSLSQLGHVRLLVAACAERGLVAQASPSTCSALRAVRRHPGRHRHREVRRGRLGHAGGDRRWWSRCASRVSGALPAGRAEAARGSTRRCRSSRSRPWQPRRRRSTRRKPHRGACWSGGYGGLGIHTLLRSRSGSSRTTSSKSCSSRSA